MAGPQSQRGVRYLALASGSMIAFGAAMVVTPRVSDVLFNWLIFGRTGPPEGFTDTAVDFLRFSHGVMGAVMVGWFSLVLWHVRGPLAAGLDGSQSALTGSLLGWFLLDSTYSVVEGYWQNAALNAVVLVVFVPGLWLTHPSTASPRTNAGR